MEVIHHGYNLTPEEMKKKSERNLTMLYKALETDPDNTYMLYQAAHSESMQEIILRQFRCMKRRLASWIPSRVSLSG